MEIIHSVDVKVRKLSDGILLGACKVFRRINVTKVEMKSSKSISRV